MSKKILSILAILCGIILFGIAYIYFSTPAGSLPSFVPGYAVGSMTIHLKHGIAALLLGLAAFAYAWFSSGKKTTTTAA